MSDIELKKAFRLHLLHNWRKTVVGATNLLVVSLAVFILSTGDKFFDYYLLNFLRLLAMFITLLLLSVALLVKNISPKQIRIVGITYVAIMLLLIATQIHICEIFYPELRRGSFDSSMALYLGVILFAQPIRDRVEHLIFFIGILNILFLYRHFNLESISNIIPFVVFLLMAYLLSRTVHKIQYESFCAREKIADSNQKLEHLLKLQRDAQIQLKDAHAHDSLTQTYHREHGLDLLQNAAMKARKTHLPLTICFFDLDALKDVNDKYGHKVGDQYIRTIINLIKDGSDHVPIIRLGGDEFLMIFEEKSYEYVVDVFRTIDENTEAFNSENHHVFNLGFSYGIVEYDSSKYIHIDNFIDDADRLMYQQKMKKKQALIPSFKRKKA